MMTVDNNDALYVKRTDQSDLNFLCVYYFLLRKGVSFLENFLLKNQKQQQLQNILTKQMMLVTRKQTQENKGNYNMMNYYPRNGQKGDPELSTE